MNHHKLTSKHSILGTNKSSLRLRKRQSMLNTLLAIAAIGILAGCAYYGPYGYPGPYYSGGIFIGGFHHGGHFGGHHSIGHGGFGHGGHGH